MLGLNRPKTKYTFKMLYYPFKEMKSGRTVYYEIPKEFRATYAKTQDINRISMNQGITADHLTIETNTSLNIRIKDKITYNNKSYIVRSVIEEINPYSGGSIKNSPSTFVKFIVME